MKSKLKSRHYAWMRQMPQPSIVTRSKNSLIPMYIHFGVEGLKAIHNSCRKSGLSAEDTLLANVIHRLKLASYTKEEIETILEVDGLVEQVNDWITKNRRMLSMGKGGVYKTLKFEVSPRELTSKEMNI